MVDEIGEGPKIAETEIPNGVVHSNSTGSETGNASNVDRSDRPITSDHTEPDNTKVTESRNSTEDREKAEQFWKEQLTGEVLITDPQDPSCQISVVVPVYNESRRSILKQLRSIAGQQGVRPEQFEVIYVINNGPDASPGARETNRAILDLPIWKNGPKEYDESGYTADEIQLMQELRALNLFVIDKSTSGNEIPDCNVAKARNRGIAEATKRFDDSGRNGIVLQTDVDSFYDNPDFFQKAINKFNETLDLIAIAGGQKIAFVTSEKNPAELEKKRQQLQRLTQFRYWLSLVQIIKGEQWGLDSHTLIPANSISRSFETAAVKGFSGAAEGDDTVLGGRLMQYAESHGKLYSYPSAKRDFVSTTIIREGGGITTSLTHPGIEDVDRDPFLPHDHLDADKRFPINELIEKYKKMVLEEKPELLKDLEFLDEVVNGIKLIVETN